jgi:hypothetical protein
VTAIWAIVTPVMTQGRKNDSNDPDLRHLPMIRTVGFARTGAWR